jgi:hypothetical protein
MESKAKSKVPVLANDSVVRTFNTVSTVPNAKNPFVNLSKGRPNNQTAVQPGAPSQGK